MEKERTPLIEEKYECKTWKSLLAPVLSFFLFFFSLLLLGRHTMAERSGGGGGGGALRARILQSSEIRVNKKAVVVC